MPDPGQAPRSVLGAAITRLSRRRLPQVEGSLHLRGLDAPAEIIRDAWGVPHIYAASVRDLLFAQGYAHAQDRLWQMDLMRRVATGRLSQVMGPFTERTDRQLRTLGVGRVAAQEEGIIHPALHADLAAYAAGVNAFIQQGPLPLEFSILHYRPHPWAVVDVLAMSKLMAWFMSTNWESELLRAQLLERLGPERTEALEACYLDRWPCTVPGELSPWKGRAPSRTTDEPLGFAAREPRGSNGWVLAGVRTERGMPLLANEMHMQMEIPAPLCENHLAGGGIDATGVSVPGFPDIIAGHNRHVAWGFTNGMVDAQDLYIERLRRSGDGRVQYEYRGGWREARVARERIHVRGKGDVIQEVIVTHHGPIVNALAPDLAGEAPLALRWPALELAPKARSALALERARDCRELHEALRNWFWPVMNAVYADDAGNTGYALVGRVPVRGAGDGRVPAPGWTGEHEWLGYIPWEEMPHLENPANGYIVNTNNRPVDGSYPYDLGQAYTTGDRAQRIVEMIEARPRIDVPYTRAMQLDQVSPAARVFARYLADLAVEQPQLAAVAAMMRGWDGDLSPESPQAAVHEVFVRRLIRLLVDSHLGDLGAGYCGKGPTPVLAEGSLYGFRAWTWLEETLGDPHSPWFDLGQGEERSAALRRALRETVAFLQRRLGRDPAGWAWGRLHNLTLTHPLGYARPIFGSLNRGPYPIGGDHTTPWGTGGSMSRVECDSITGPVFRFIADLGDLRRCQAVLAPGQSGHPASPHYADQLSAWFAGEYHPMLYAREDVEREAVARLRLAPVA